MKRTILLIMAILTFLFSCNTITINEDEYNIIITGKNPELHGKIYKINKKTKLIIIKHYDRTIPLLLYMDNKNIGLPDFPIYKPHRKNDKATIHKDTLKGFPKLGEYKMDILIKEHQISIEIIGVLIPEYDKNGKEIIDPIFDLLKGRKIILTKNSD